MSVAAPSYRHSSSPVSHLRELKSHERRDSATNLLAVNRGLPVVRPLHRIESAREARAVKSPTYNDQPTSMESLSSPIGRTIEKTISQKEENFLTTSGIQQNEDHQMSDSNCLSLAQLHIMLNQSEDLSINRQIATVERLAAQIANTIVQPCKAITELLELSRQVCLDNLRLIQEVMNTDENNDVLRKRIIEFGDVVHETRTKLDTSKRQVQTLWKTINEQQKQKRALLRIICQLENQVGRRQNERLTQTPVISPKTGPKDLQNRNFDKSPGFLCVDDSVQQIDCSQRHPSNTRERCGQRISTTNFYKDKNQVPKWPVKPQQRELTNEKPHNSKPLFTLKSKLRNQ